MPNHADSSIHIPILTRPTRFRCRGPLTGLLAVFFSLAASAAWTPPAHAQTVDVTITTDNAYSFGYGNAGGLSSLYGGIENCTAGQIFNCAGGPETYPGIPAPSGAYLYIIAYSDGSVTQGALGQFVSGANTVDTGNGSWEVYATGHDIEPNCFGPPNSPSMTAINAEIATANAQAGGLNSSVGWVTIQGGQGCVGALAVGEDNSSPTGHFPIVCGIEPAARWMWYTPDASTITDPFQVGPPPHLPNDVNEYLIFRLPTIIVTPAARPTWGRIKATFH